MAIAIIRLMLAQGRRRIGIRTARENDWVLVEISDGGPGVPEGVRDRVFKPFFTTKDIGKGTGTGLNTSYRIVVEQHGGYTRFQVRLPMEGSVDREALRNAVRSPVTGR